MMRAIVSYFVGYPNTKNIERKIVFDKMVRTYQQDGEIFLEDAVLRYFDPKRPVVVDMVTYKFWNTPDIQELLVKFFYHLDDIWKITSLEKMRFHIFQLEFCLRQYLNHAEEPRKEMVRAALENIAAILDISGGDKIQGYACLFYSNLTDAKLLELFYGYNRQRGFRDLENKTL